MFLVISILNFSFFELGSNSVENVCALCCLQVSRCVFLVNTRKGFEKRFCRLNTKTSFASFPILFNETYFLLESKRGKHSESRSWACPLIAMKIAVIIQSTFAAMQLSRHERTIWGRKHV